MKNVIEIDMLNNCTCNLISNVNDGTNLLVLSIKCDVTSNPELVMQNKTVPITTNPFLYEIKESDLMGDGNIVFYLLDNEHMGNNFTIAKALSSGNLYLKRVTDFIYKLQAIKTSESESIDLSNYYTKTEVDNLLIVQEEKKEEFRYFHFEYSMGSDKCIMGNTNLLGEMVLPQGAYMLFVTLSVYGSMHNPPPVKKASLQLDYLIDERGVPHGSFNIFTLVDIAGKTDGIRFYESDGNDKVEVKVLLDTNDLENQMIGELANVVCEVEIYAVKAGNKFVQEN